MSRAAETVRVLLVDDDEDAFVLTRDLLARVGAPRCLLEWRDSYEEALTAILERRHDVYLVDYRLGPDDGIDLVRAAATQRIEAPFILLTVTDDAEVDASAAAAGAADYLVKGTLSPSLLGRAIRYALARQKHLDAVRRSEHEKAVLLKEIHHRVKNNLQIISSLLKLQAERTTEPSVACALGEAEGRVRSMALIHEHLYQSPSLADVDMAAYAHRLVSVLMQMTGVSGKVGVSLAIRDVSLEIEAAVPCGLILNELVTNALKHAFPAPDGREPELIVRMTREVGGYSMTVADNGRGLPEGFDAARAGSMGMYLVRTLTRQLGGEATFTREEGTCCTILFPSRSRAETNGAPP